MGDQESNIPDLDVVTLDHVAHLLVREQLGNLDNVVVVLLRSVRELFPVLLVPRYVPERAERDFAEGEDRLGHVAFLRLEEHQSSIQGIDTCRVVHRHLSDALKQLGDWRRVFAISDSVHLGHSGRAITHATRHCTCRSVARSR